jgi:hypothetical protein
MARETIGGWLKVKWKVVPPKSVNPGLRWRIENRGRFTRRTHQRPVPPKPA